jgi:uncharacterized protein (DUF58 family)
MRFLTRRGFGFIFAAVNLFVIGDVTRTGWVQIADAVFWGAIFASVLVAGISSGGLRVSPRFFVSSQGSGGPGTAQGDEVGIEAEVINNWPLPRFGVTLSYNLYVNDHLATLHADQRVKIHVPFLAPRSRTIVKGSMTSSRRGMHRLADGIAASDAPFGVFKRSQRQTGETALMVYPAPVEIELAPSRLVHAGERPKPVTARSGEEVVGSRPYVVGDSARSIHWRNSARAGRIMTKAFAATEQETPVLLVAGGSMLDASKAEESLDDRCRVAAGVSLESGKHGVPLSMLTGRTSQRVSWAETLAHLAALTSSTVQPMADQLTRLDPAASVAVIVDVADSESVSALVADAPRLSSLDVWLLAEPSDEHEWQANRVASALRSVGAYVSVVERPLPKPEPLAPQAKQGVSA